MPKFQYTALDSQGQETSGTMEASSSSEVSSALRQSGYYPTDVSEAASGGGTAVATKPRGNSGGGAAAAGKRNLFQQAGGGETAPATRKKSSSITLFEKKTVKSKTLMIFTRQLATLIDAGLPLLKGLDVLAKQEKDKVLKKTIRSLADSVQGGSTFSESLAQHPRIFNKLYINMVKAGELGGVLEVVLIRLAEFQEKAQKLKNKVTSAMIYPVIVLFISVLILGFLLMFIVPQFEKIFNDLLEGAELPALTQFVIGASEMVQDKWWIFLLIIVALVVTYKLLVATDAGERAVDRLKLGTPLMGDLIRKSSISRFSRTLGTLVSSGVPILQALTITRETAGNRVIADAITKVHDSVKEGESVVQPLEASRVFPPMVISMIDVGEETGQLPDMLLKIADVYDDEVDNSVAGLTSLLEPIMIVFLAVIVGTIVIALFLPLIEIIRRLNSQ
jgi:type IV pilus assembly protein PilC